MKEITKALGVSGQHVSDEELLNYITDGHGSKFDHAIIV